MTARAVAAVALAAVLLTTGLAVAAPSETFPQDLLDAILQDAMEATMALLRQCRDVRWAWTSCQEALDVFIDALIWKDPCDPYPVFELLLEAAPGPDAVLTWQERSGWREKLRRALLHVPPRYWLTILERFPRNLWDPAAMQGLAVGEQQEIVNFARELKMWLQDASDPDHAPLAPPAYCDKRGP